MLFKAISGVFRIMLRQVNQLHFILAFDLFGSGVLAQWPDTLNLNDGKELIGFCFFFLFI